MPIPHNARLNRLAMANIYKSTMGKSDYTLVLEKGEHKDKFNKLINDYSIGPGRDYLKERVDVFSSMIKNSTSSLRSVKKNDVLYINAHGLPAQSDFFLTDVMPL